MVGIRHKLTGCETGSEAGMWIISLHQSSVVLFVRVSVSVSRLFRSFCCLVFFIQFFKILFSLSLISIPVYICVCRGLFSPSHGVAKEGEKQP